MKKTECGNELLDDLLLMLCHIRFSRLSWCLLFCWSSMADVVNVVMMESTDLRNKVFILSDMHVVTAKSEAQFCVLRDLARSGLVDLLIEQSAAVEPDERLACERLLEIVPYKRVFSEEFEHQLLVRLSRIVSDEHPRRLVCIDRLRGWYRKQFWRKIFEEICFTNGPRWDSVSSQWFRDRVGDFLKTQRLLANYADWTRLLDRVEKLLRSEEALSWVRCIRDGVWKSREMLDSLLCIDGVCPDNFLEFLQIGADLGNLYEVSQALRKELLGSAFPSPVTYGVHNCVEVEALEKILSGNSLCTVLVAGGAHAENLEKILQFEGYRTVFCYGVKSKEIIAEYISSELGRKAKEQAEIEYTELYAFKLLRPLVEKSAVDLKSFLAERLS